MKNKDTIYVDVDDEITTIIDKVQNAENKIVALVLPKRAAVLQSVVNMKLLKRSADNAKKQVVLITSESGLMPLAGSVGFYVAKTLQSKPEVPVIDEDETAAQEEVVEAVALDDDSDDDFDARKNAKKPIGVLSGEKATDPKAVAASNTDADDDSIDMSQEDQAEPEALADDSKDGKSKKDKNLAVPNFLRFRKWFILGFILLILLIGFGYVATAVLPKATVTIKTDTTDVVVDRTLTLSTQQKELNTKDAIIPAVVKQFESKVSQQAEATGQKNLGEKATGTVHIINCSPVAADSYTIPAGTGISRDGLTYITQKTVNLPLGGGNSCADYGGTTSANVAVTAISGGAQYNLEPGSFTAAKSSNGNYVASNLKISSSNAFTGGTDKVVKVVSKDDIDNLKQKLNTTASEADKAKEDIKQKLSDAGYQPILETFAASDPQITASAQVDEQADSVTVTQTVTYSMFGVSSSDLEKLIEAKAAEKINTNTQSLLSNGLDKAIYSLVGTPTADSAQIKFRAEALAGPKIDVDSLKKELAGQKSGQAETKLKSIIGVKDASVKLSPFWVVKIPSDASKVTINFEQYNNGQ